MASIYNNYNFRQRVLAQVQDMERNIYMRNGQPYYGFHDFMRGTQQYNREDYEEQQAIEQHTKAEYDEEQRAVQQAEQQDGQLEQMYAPDNIDASDDVEELLFDYKPSINELFE